MGKNEEYKDLIKEMGLPDPNDSSYFRESSIKINKE